MIILSVLSHNSFASPSSSAWPTTLETTALPSTGIRYDPLYVSGLACTSGELAANTLVSEPVSDVSNVSQRTKRTM